MSNLLLLKIVIALLFIVAGVLTLPFGIILIAFGIIILLSFITAPENVFYLLPLLAGANKGEDDDWVVEIAEQAKAILEKFIEQRKKGKTQEEITKALKDDLIKLLQTLQKNIDKMPFEGISGQLTKRALKKALKDVIEKLKRL